MAELELSAPPAETQQPLPSASVTETTDIVVDPKIEEGFESLGRAMNEAIEKKGKEREAQSEETEEAEKPEKKGEAKPAPKTEEPEETDPKKLALKMIEAERGEEEKVESTPEKEEEQVEIPDSVKSEKAKDRYIELHRNWKGEEARAARLEKENLAKEAKIKELEARKPDGVPEDIKPKLEQMENELLQYRRQYQLETSPEVKKQFDDVVVESEKTIIATLKRHGLTPEMEKVIEGEGGFLNFANSMKPVKRADGETVTLQEMAKDWLQSISLTDARAIESSMDEQLRTKNAKARFIADEKSKAKEFFEGHQKNYQASVEQQQKAQLEQKQKIESFLTKTTTETPWMKDLEAPANASEEEKKQIAADNKFRAGLRNVLKATLSTSSLEELLDAALDATGYLYERRENAKLSKENKTLKDRIAKMQAGSGTTPKSGSIATQKAEPKPRGSARVYDGVSADSLESELDRLAAG